MNSVANANMLHARPNNRIGLNEIKSKDLSCQAQDRPIICAKVEDFPLSRFKIATVLISH